MLASNFDFKSSKVASKVLNIDCRIIADVKSYPNNITLLGTHYDQSLLQVYPHNMELLIKLLIFSDFHCQSQPQLPWVRLCSTNSSNSKLFLLEEDFKFL
jgi:hypothetical protein